MILTQKSDVPQVRHATSLTCYKSDMPQVRHATSPTSHMFDVSQGRRRGSPKHHKSEAPQVRSTTSPKDIQKFTNNSITHVEHVLVDGCLSVGFVCRDGDLGEGFVWH